MARLPFAVAAFVLVAVGIAVVPGADESVASRKASATLAERLAGVKNVGLVYEPRLGGFQLIVLNEVLHQHLMVNLQMTQTLFAEREEQELELKRLQLADNKDFDAIDKLARSLEREVEYPFASGGEMFQITQTTSEYVELEAFDTLEGRPKTLVVIPWQRVSLISFPQYIEKHMPGQRLLQTLSVLNGEKAK